MKDDVERAAEVIELDEKYSVVRVGGKTRVMWFTSDRGRQLANFSSFHDFKDFLSNKKILVEKSLKALATVWLNDPERPTYEGVVFEPNGKQVVNGRLNLWRGWGVKPKQGKWPLMRRHIKEVIAAGNAEFEEYVMNWSARMFQEPSEQGQVAVCLYSEEEGAGKGTWANALVRLWGQHGIQISSTKHLVGNFNAHLQDCGLLFSDEALWPGDHAAEGTLKRLITEPTLFIERKGLDGYTVKNFVHAILASNRKWIVPASVTARRFAVNEVSAQYVGDRPYWDALRAEVNGDGLSAMLYDLLKKDISGFDVFDIPKTKALMHQKMLSLDPFDQWWLELLERGSLPGKADKPWRAHTHLLVEDARRAVPQLRYLTEKAMGTQLYQRKCRRFNSGQRGWEFPSLTEARKAWEERIGERCKWLKQEDWE